MVFSDILSQISEAPSVDIGRGMMSSAIRAGLDEGMSGAAMLSDLKSIGYGIRNVDFYGLVRETKATMAAGSVWAEQAIDQIPEAAAFVEHAGAAATFYEYRVPVLYRTLGTEEHVPSSVVFNIRSAERITNAQAIEAANNYFLEGKGNPNYERQEFLGNGTVGLHFFHP